MKKRNFIFTALVVCVFTFLFMVASQVSAATGEEIAASIDAGIAWLIGQQQTDGSWLDWGCNPGGTTGFAIVKLSERAFELGYDSPFDEAYPYRENVENGLNYLFTLASIIEISPQPAGDPDGDADGIGVYFTDDDWHRTYGTGIALMAIASTMAPDRVVNAAGSPVNGWTYKQVMDDAVDYMAFGQNDEGCEGRGGWGYSDNACWGDNSNGGYAVLGLAYAESDAYGFNCTIPQFVRDELDFWIDYIQGDDGGSGYSWPNDWTNVLKTGNLIFQMAFYGDGPEVPRVQDALEYLGNMWNDPSRDPGWQGPPPHYQAMYCIMKGLEYRGVDTIMVEGVERDWYDDFAAAIVANQQEDGSWPGDYWGGQSLATLWALLTLEKSAPPVAEINGQCILAGESFEPVNLDETINPSHPGAPPYTWTVTGNVDLSVEIDVDNVMTVTYSQGWIGSETLTVTCTDSQGYTTTDYPTFIVCGVPIVLDIPDQNYPFEAFDLDDYLDPSCGLTASEVEWSHSVVPEGWTVTIDSDNVATVAAPEDATDPVTITFTATSAVCPCESPSDSDEAAFIFNQPPDCSEAYADQECLWPPNHKMVPVSILGVTDPDGDPVTINITAITSDEPTATAKGAGGAKHAPDADGVGTDTASLRAERSGSGLEKGKSGAGPGNGRVYVITFTAGDGRGGECVGTVQVVVPHDHRRPEVNPSHNGPDHLCDAVDDGQNYDATQIN